MKKTLTSSLLGLSCLAAVNSTAQQHLTGPNSSLPPYQAIFGTNPDAKIVSILTVGDAVGGYKFAGLADGTGAFDNGDGSFTVLVNHEMGSNAGVTRAHGSKGAFVSKWVINKDPNDLRVLSGSDLMQKIHLWDKANQMYVSYYVTTPFTNGLSRFCSADLPAPSAFYNETTGKGTRARIFTNGEESGMDGRPFAHIVTGPEAGNSYDLPYLGRASWENYVACPRMSDTTIAIGLDDGTDGQVYVYVGVKQTTGNEIEKAGLTGGKLYGISVPGLIAESNGHVIKDSAFTLVDLGNVRDASGSAINTTSNNMGVMKFQRPEDGAWDPLTNDFYFLTTASVSGQSRMYRLRFNDPGNPAAGGMITAVLEGNEGQIMMDNLGIDNFGHILIQEDQGGDISLASTWQYNIAENSFKRLLIHDSTLFYHAGPSRITTNEEASGIIDVQHILGPGWFLGSDQVHNGSGMSPELAERGQLFAFFNPDTYNANPEISLVGNNTEILNGSMNPSTGNNTDFGNVIRTKKTSKSFVIKSEGPADLTISNINFTGANGNEFTLVNPPAFPFSVPAGDSQVITVEFAPANVGLRTAEMHLQTNDFDEKNFAIAVQGVALDNTGIASLPDGSALQLFPNPAKDQVTVSITLKNADHIAVNILDVNGRTMMSTQPKQYQAGEQKIVLATDLLPNGTYYVQVATGNAITRTKLVIMH